MNSFTICVMVSATVHRLLARRTIRGFTLIELLIVVAVVAILAMVAYPSYMESVRKSRRGDAIAELNRVAQAQERWRATNPNFNNADVSSAATGLRLVSGTTVAANYALPSGLYTIAIGTGALSRTTHTVTATAVGAQTSDTACAFLRLTTTDGNVVYWAGASVATLADAATNVNARRCWGR